MDKESAKVVKRIYRLVIEGYGVTQIADILTKEKILIPSAYAELYYPENNHSSKKRGIDDPTFWTPTTIGYILEKQEYMGHTVLGKTICVDYKTKKRRKATEEELIIFKNTHEAIIDEETWHNAQRLRKTVRRSPKYGTTSHPLTGLLYCADCGGKLSYREPAEHKEKLKIATARNEELNILITKLYEDYALKKITEKHFERLFKKYDEEQSDTENKMKIYQKEIDDYSQSKADTGKFLRMIKKYTDFETLTTPMLNEYIEKIIVHEATGARKGKDRKQHVDIYFNFIGRIEKEKS